MVKYAYPDINKSTLENSFENDIFKALNHNVTT